MKTRIAATLGVAALSIAALAGCSGGGGSQTTDEACAIIETDMVAASEALNELNPANEDDMKAATESFVTALNDAEAKVTNAEVKEAFVGVKDVFEAAFEDFSLENMENLVNIASDIQEPAEKLAALCPGAASGF